MAKRATLSIHVKCVQTQTELHKYIPFGMYAGATKDPGRRAKQHEKELGLSGKRDMYYWKTSNMKNAENKLLGKKGFELNDHKVSNADEEPGYVYIIV